MNRLQEAWQVLTGRKDTIPVPGGTPRFVELNGNIIAATDNKQAYLDKGFNSNDTVFAATQLISEKIKLAPWLAYRVEDEKALKEYQAIITKGQFTGKEFTRATELRAKALVPTDQDTRLNELLKFPNPEDTFSDLVANSSVNKLLLGSRFIHGTLLDGGANAGKPIELNILPSQDITLVVSRTWPFRILAYKIMAWQDKTFSRAEVMHDKYFNPNFSITGEHLYGFAPMRSAQFLVDRSNSENIASAMAFHNGGPRMIIWVDDTRFDASENMGQVAAIKEKLTGRDYAGPYNTNKLAASAYKMGATAVGSTPLELGISDSEKNTLRRICNVIGGLPSQLLNDPDNKIYSNMQEGEKALTTRAALPLLNSFRDHFNRKLGEDWGYKGQNIYVDYDITVYSELQEDLGKKWAWVERLPVPNGYKLDMMGLDHPVGQEEFMETILLPSSLTTSDDYLGNQTDEALAQGDGGLSGDTVGEDVQDDTAGA